VFRILARQPHVLTEGFRDSPPSESLFNIHEPFPMSLGTV